MKRIFFPAVLMSCLLQPAHADYLDDIGYSALKQQLGSATPSGTGVTIMQVEAATGTEGSGLPIWSPVATTTDSAYSGVTFNFVTGSSGRSGSTSGHASGVGQLLYGNQSMASGVTTVQLAYAVDWMLNDFLRAGTPYQPVVSSARVINHSWVGRFQSGSTTFPEADAEVLRRTDWLVERDSVINVVAMNNGSTNQPLLGSSFNSIAVGLTSGNHPQGSFDLGATDSMYGAGRTRPDLVAPRSNTSGAAPVVASLAAMLVETGHTGGYVLSHGSTTARSGATVYNAERAETIKAVLMAGADRITNNTSSSNEISDYRAVGYATANGLDSRYGAGQVNAENSYRIVAAGEQEAGSVLCSVSVQTCAGFDYVENFGGVAGSASELSYTFIADDSHDQLAAALVWNLDVNSFAADGAAILRHLSLSLFDETSGQMIGSSASLNDNTQNLWYQLVSGHSYTLTVASLESGNFNWSYALAWNIGDAASVAPVPLPAAAWMLISGLLGLAPLIRRRLASTSPATFIA